MSGSVGFGIIGAGNIGWIHAEALRQAPNARLVAVADMDSAAGIKLASNFLCRQHLNFRQMLKDLEVEAVCICTPSGTHRDFAVACAQAGRHVLCEKPLEITSGRIDQMIAAATEAGVYLSGVFQSRFTKAARYVKEAIDQGRFGQLRLGNAYVKWFRDNAYYQGNWRGTKKLDGGGALMNQSIHQIDLLLWFMGPVKRLVAQTANMGHEGLIEVEDIATAQLQFSSGAFGTIEGSTALRPPDPARIEIHGAQGCAVIEDGLLRRWEFVQSLPVDEEIRAEAGLQSILGNASGDPIAGLKPDGHVLQITDFANAILSGEQPFVDGTEGRKAVALIEAIYRSAESRRWICL